MKKSGVQKHQMGRVLKILSPVLSPRIYEFVLGLLLVLASTCCELLAPYLLGKGTDIVISPGANSKDLTKIVFAFLGVIVLRAVFEMFQALVIQRTGQKVIHDLRIKVFTKVHTLPISYFDSHPTGRILTRVINDIKALSELFTASISVLILDVMIVLGSIGSMLWMDLDLALITLVTIPLVFWTIWRFGEQLSEAYKTVRSRLSQVNSFLGENIGAIGTIQRLGAEHERLTTFSQIVDGHTEAQMKALKIYASVQPYANVLNGVAMASLMGVGGYWAIQGKISLGVLVAFFGYLRNLYQPIRDMVEKYNTFLSAMVAAERVVDILEEPSESVDLVLPDRKTAGTIKDSSIVFDGVFFKYPTRESWALDNVSFEIEHGKSLAVVGTTGSGKSSLIRLLLRFYDLSQGKITLGGREIQEFDRRILRRHIGVIQQEVYLFSGTVRANLTLGREEWDDSFLESQCRKTHLWELIQSRGGLDMPVYEGGSNLSLGEKQLIAFTRIWVFQPEVLILDEATASVDPISERYLMSAIQEGLRGRTSIVVAHRLSTIRQCDKVIVMENGKVAEMGTYDGLLKKRGSFYRFHQIYSQLGKRG